MGATVKLREKYQITLPEVVRASVPLQVGEPGARPGSGAKNGRSRLSDPKTT
jgi:hypothetical protein